MSVLRRTAIVLDRYPVWLDAIEFVVAGEGFERTEVTTDPDVALGLVETLQPELHIVGTEAFSVEIEALAHIRRVRERAQHLNVIVLSPNAEPGRVNAILAAGAFAYVLKSAEADDLAAAIRQTSAHTLHLPTLPTAGNDQAASPVAAGLTPRELEVLQLVAEGHSNAQLARLLWVTEQTVKFHLSNIYRKLEIANRTEASRWAQTHGLIRSVA
jgi:DNA-binding NarL/FixJ family response regulator